MSNIHDDAFKGSLTADSLKHYLSGDPSIIDSPGGRKSLTPLAAATLRAYLDVVRLLLENPIRPADPDALSNHNRTPLFFATSRSPAHNRGAIVRLLLDNGADVDLCYADDNYNTPLMNAITEVRDKEVVHELVDCGASLFKENAAGDTAMTLAKKIGMEPDLRPRNERSSSGGELSNDFRTPSGSRTMIPLQAEDAFSKNAKLCLDGRIIRDNPNALGFGGFADVYQGLFENRKVAIKVVRHFGLRQEKLLRRLWREYLTWSNLSHSNILSCLGYAYDFSSGAYALPSLISPWMENGTCLAYLETHPDADRVHLLIGIGNGLHHLHTCKPVIVHGDLRAGNILVSDQGVPCLTDFGLSRVLEEVRGMTTSSDIAGSLRWMSPELFKSGSTVSIQSDVWAYGMTILEILTGQRPYLEEKQDLIVFGLANKGEVPSRPRGVDDQELIDDEVWAACRCCWSFEPAARPSIDAVVKMITRPPRCEHSHGDVQVVNTFQQPNPIHQIRDAPGVGEDDFESAVNSPRTYLSTLSSPAQSSVFASSADHGDDSGSSAITMRPTGPVILTDILGVNFEDRLHGIKGTKEEVLAEAVDFNPKLWEGFKEESIAKLIAGDAIGKNTRPECEPGKVDTIAKIEKKGGSDTSDNPINILCFDGGGVRGLSSLLILRELLQRLPTDPRTHKSPRPCDIFDIICGTSTGGIIALMLGRLRMSIEDAVSSYQSFSKTVFEVGNLGSSKGTFWMGLDFLSETVFGQKKETGPARYDASKLRKWMEDLVAKSEGDGQAPLLDPKGTRCRTFVVAVSESHADAPPKLFRTYVAEGEPADECTIWEAARATTAAVPFFEAATVGSPPEEFVDGWFSGSNNPSRLAIQEAGNIFPSRRIGCLLSLGTGVPTKISIPKNDDEIDKACLKLVQSCERVHEDTYKDFKQNKRGEGYVRLSVNRGLDDIRLDEWSRETELTSITGGYLRHGEVKERVEKCVAMLKEKAGDSRGTGRLRIYAHGLESPQRSTAERAKGN